MAARRQNPEELALVEAVARGVAREVVKRRGKRTQQHLAAASRVTRATVVAVENGRPVRLVSLALIARGLQVPLADLFHDPMPDDHAVHELKAQNRLVFDFRRLTGDQQKLIADFVRTFANASAKRKQERKRRRLLQHCEVHVHRHER